MAGFVGCRHTPPSAGAEPEPEAWLQEPFEMPLDACRIGGPLKWRPTDAEPCRVPLEQMRPWPEGVVETELVAVDYRSHRVGLRVKMKDGRMRPLDFYWSAAGPGDHEPGRLTGDLRFTEPRAGDGSCPGTPATHALRVWFLEGEGHLLATLPLSCDAEPPGWFGDNAVTFELPVPGGETRVLGPAPMDLVKAPDRPLSPEAVEAVAVASVAPECVGSAFHLDGMGADERCEIPHSDVGTFPGPELLALEAEPLAGHPGEALRFEVVYRNISGAPVVVDIHSFGWPLSAMVFYRDGVRVEEPPGCVPDSLARVTGHRVLLEPGGALTMPVETALQPGGAWLHRGGGGQCDVVLPPGRYEVDVRAPGRPGGRVDRVDVEVAW